MSDTFKFILLEPLFNLNLIKINAKFMLGLLNNSELI
jgi:hypothetical protein